MPAAFSAVRIFSPRLRFSRRFRAELATLLLAAGMVSATAQEMKPECAGLLKNFDRLISLYADAGTRAIDKMDPGPAMDRARAAAIKGDAGATITMIGIGVILRGRADQFPVEMVRQVCAYSARNGHPLHIATCAFFNALNPLGDRAQKRIAAEAEVARFDQMRSAPRAGFAAADEVAGHVDALKACLPRT